MCLKFVMNHPGLDGGKIFLAKDTSNMFWLLLNWREYHQQQNQMIFIRWIRAGEFFFEKILDWEPQWFFCLPLRSSMFSSWSLGSSTISTPSSTPFCTQFFRRAFEEVSQTCLESVGFTRWDFGEIRPWVRISQKFAKAVSRRSEEEETSLDQEQELILVIGRTG